MVWPPLKFASYTFSYYAPPKMLLLSIWDHVNQFLLWHGFIWKVLHLPGNEARQLRLPDLPDCLLTQEFRDLGYRYLFGLVWFGFLFFICLFAFKKLHINVFCTAQLELWPSYASLCVQSKWTELGMFYYRWSLSGLTCQYQRPQNNQLLNDSVTPVRARSGHTTLPSPGHSCALVLHIYMHLSPH